MKKQRILLTGLAGCILTGAGLGLTFVLFAGQEQAVSADAMGQVQIDICRMDSGEEYTADCVNGVLPGETIDRATAVILDGESPEAYIRVRLDFGGILGEIPSAEKGEKQREWIRELRDGIDFCGGWLEGEDGFYYYQEKVAPGSIIPVYQRITIPENWDNEIAEKAFTIELSAEAVQADCLEPWLAGGTEEILRWN